MVVEVVVMVDCDDNHDENDDVVVDDHDHYDSGGRDANSDAIANRWSSRRAS